MSNPISQIDPIATKPYCSKPVTNLMAKSSNIQAYTVDGHAIITTIAILPFGNLKHTDTTIINST
jgi:hypothetical protein